MKHQKPSTQHLTVAAAGAVRPVKLLVLRDVTNGPSRAGSRSRHPLPPVATVPGGHIRPGAARRVHA